MGLLRFLWSKMTKRFSVSTPEVRNTADEPSGWEPHVSSLCVHFALWKRCKERLPEEEAHHTAGGMLPGGRTSASAAAHRQPLLGAACTNTLSGPAHWSVGSVAETFPPFVFLGSLPVPLNCPFVCPPPPACARTHGTPQASTAHSCCLAGGVAWGQRMVRYYKLKKEEWATMLPMEKLVFPYPAAVFLIFRIYCFERCSVQRCTSKDRGADGG